MHDDNSNNIIITLYDPNDRCDITRRILALFSHNIVHLPHNHNGLVNGQVRGSDYFNNNIIWDGKTSRNPKRAESGIRE